MIIIQIIMVALIVIVIIVVHSNNNLHLHKTLLPYSRTINHIT